MSAFRKLPDKVEFRWRQHEEDWQRRLVDSARDANRAIGDHARELLKTAMAVDEELRQEIHMLRQEVSQVRRELAALAQLKEALRTVHQNTYELRDNLATVTVKLLVDAGKIELASALRWAEETLDAQ